MRETAQTIVIASMVVLGTHAAAIVLGGATRAARLAGWRSGRRGARLGHETPEEPLMPPRALLPLRPARHACESREHSAELAPRPLAPLLAPACGSSERGSR